MQQAQGLEGTQELPLDESPPDGKDFLEDAGYVRIKAYFLQKYFKETFFLNVACQIACMHVLWLFVALSYNFFNFEKHYFFKSTSLSLQ